MCNTIHFYFNWNLTKWSLLGHYESASLTMILSLMLLHLLLIYMACFNMYHTTLILIIMLQVIQPFQLEVKLHFLLANKDKIVIITHKVINKQYKIDSLLCALLLTDSTSLCSYPLKNLYTIIKNNSRMLKLFWNWVSGNFTYYFWQILT